MTGIRIAFGRPHADSEMIIARSTPCVKSFFLQKQRICATFDPDSPPPRRPGPSFLRPAGAASRIHARFLALQGAAVSKGAAGAVIARSAATRQSASPAATPGFLRCQGKRIATPVCGPVCNDEQAVCRRKTANRGFAVENRRKYDASAGPLLLNYRGRCPICQRLYRRWVSARARFLKAGSPVTSCSTSISGGRAKGSAP